MAELKKQYGAYDRAARTHAHTHTGKRLDHLQVSIVSWPKQAKKVCHVFPAIPMVHIDSSSPQILSALPWLSIPGSLLPLIWSGVLEGTPVYPEGVTKCHNDRRYHSLCKFKDSSLQSSGSPQAALTDPNSNCT